MQGLCPLSNGCLLYTSFGFFIDPFHDVDVLLLSLHSACAVAAHELFHVGNADTVKVADDAVLQTGSCNCKLERRLLVLILVQAVDQTARKAVAAAHAVNNVADPVSYTHLKKQTDDPIFKAYRKEYKKRFAWIKAGRITDEQFYAWSEQAREEKKKCDREIISLEEFQQWLRDSKI